MTDKAPEYLEAERILRRMAVQLKVATAIVAFLLVAMIYVAVRA